MLTTFFSKEERPYTGPELRPHYLLTEFGLRGDALAAFIGPCRVETAHLVDWEDRLKSDFIEARWMVHFLGEFFGAPLREGVLLQRLLIATMAESITQALASASGPGARAVSRKGNDLYVDSRKLSVSVVTASPVSQVLHAGVNIDPSGAPVPAIGLQELGIAPGDWAQSILAAFAAEWESLDWACAKVRPVM